MHFAVAPLVGAWIETTHVKFRAKDGDVAPLVGAWIETLPSFMVVNNGRSHPSWVRGLKLLLSKLKLMLIKVAPIVGAWIETPWNTLR